jgi:hypothetical protein
LRIDSRLVVNEERSQRQFESKRKQRPTAKYYEAPVRLSVAEALCHAGTVASRESADHLWPKHSEKPDNQSTN